MTDDNMTIADNIERIADAAKMIRDRMATLGVAGHSDKINVVADKVKKISHNIVDVKVGGGDVYKIPGGYYKDGESRVTGVGSMETSGGDDVWWSPKMLSNTTAQPPSLVYPDLQEKTVTPSTSDQTIIPDEGYDGLGKVDVTAAALQEKTITPSETSQVVTPDTNYYGLSKVTADPIPSTYKDTSDASATAADIVSGKTAYINGGKVTGTATLTSDPKLQTKSVSPTTSQQIVTPDSTYDGLSKVTVGAATLQTKTITPSTSSQSVTPDSSYYGLSKVTVSAVSLQSKTATPSASSQTITAGSGYQGLSQVTVSAIPSKYKDTSDATATAEEILEGKTAYVNGVLVTGTGDISMEGLIRTKMTLINNTGQKLLVYSMASNQYSSTAQLQANDQYEFTFARGSWCNLVSAATISMYGTVTSGVVSIIGSFSNPAHPAAIDASSGKQLIGRGGIGLLCPNTEAVIKLTSS